MSSLFVIVVYGQPGQGLCCFPNASSAEVMSWAGHLDRLPGKSNVDGTCRRVSGGLGIATFPFEAMLAASSSRRVPLCLPCAALHSRWQTRASVPTSAAYIARGSALCATGSNVWCEQARANGNAYSSVYDTQTSLPESGPPQREGIIDSRNSDQIASEHMASGQICCTRTLAHADTVLHSVCMICACWQWLLHTQNAAVQWSDIPSVLTCLPFSGIPLSASLR